VFECFGADKLMSRWRGTRLCKPLLADSS